MKSQVAPALILKALQKGVSPKKVARYLFETASPTRRSRTLERLLRTVTELADNEADRYRMKVFTATALTENQKDALKRLAQKEGKRNVIVEEHLRPALKGGAIVTHKGERVDQSISGRLKKLEFALWHK